MQSIPPAFIKHFNGTIPKKAILIDHAGKSWPVGLEQIDDRVCFKYGWQRFASDHSMEFGDFLIFKYNKSYLFEVKIFSKTGCKKDESVAIENTMPIVNLEEDSEADQTCSPRTHAGNPKHSHIGTKKKEAVATSNIIPIVILEEDSEAEQTCGRTTHASKRTLSNIDPKKKEEAGGEL